jgi:hypothetical protein
MTMAPARLAGVATSPKLLVVGNPRQGTSLLAEYLHSVGLRTVTDTRHATDYPSGFMEHLPALLFTKACERLRGQRDRLTDESLIKEEFLEIPCMRVMFEEAYRVFDEPSVDFIKLPDHALALEFMHRRFPELRYLGVWRRPREAIASYYRREFGRYPGVRGLFYAIGTWNMYARRLVDFKTEHPELMDIVCIDDLIARNGSLSPVLRKRGFGTVRDRAIRDVLRKEWGRSTGIVGTGLPFYEAVFRRLVPREQKVFFDSRGHLRLLEAVSI